MHQCTAITGGFNSATARSRGETCRAARSRSCVRTRFNSATARSRGETATASGSRGRRARDASIRPRHGAVEKPSETVANAILARRGFNSATARSRGETAVRNQDVKVGHKELQFGHGTEPWRNAERSIGDHRPLHASIRPRHGAVEKQLSVRSSPSHAIAASIRPRHGAVEKRAASLRESRRVEQLQFGHGTEPWRNRADITLGPCLDVRLQFGHGTEPWRNRSIAASRADHVASFNSATARSRGET